MANPIERQIATLLDNAHQVVLAPYDFVLSQDGKTLDLSEPQSTQAAFSAGSGDGRNFRFYEIPVLGRAFAKGPSRPPT